MSDTTSTSTPPKKMWTRCNGCQDRIYNDAHDIKIHRLHCPGDLLLAIQGLRKRLDKLDDDKNEDSLLSRVDYLEQQVGDLDDHISEPTLDPDGVDLDAYTSVLGADDIEEPAAEAYEDAVAAFTPPETTSAASQVFNPVTGLYEPQQ